MTKTDSAARKRSLPQIPARPLRHFEETLQPFISNAPTRQKHVGEGQAAAAVRASTRSRCWRFLRWISKFSTVMPGPGV